MKTEEDWTLIFALNSFQQNGKKTIFSNRYWSQLNTIFPLVAKKATTWALEQELALRYKHCDLPFWMNRFEV